MFFEGSGVGSEEGTRQDADIDRFLQQILKTQSMFDVFNGKAVASIS